jgi:hypothetical protein
MQYVPQDTFANLPSPPSQNAPYYLQDNTTGYYNVYNYSYVIFLMNNTFQSAFAGLLNLCTNANVALPTNQSPIMSFNTTTLTANINIDNNAYGTNESGKLNIYFNQSMYQLFNSFPVYLKGYSQPLGKVFQLSNSFLTDPTTIPQEYSTVGSWNPVLSIVFTTSCLPIIANQIALPQVYVNALPLSSSSTAGAFNVITDLIASDFQYKPFLIYNPSAQYRFIALRPGAEIRHVDIQLYYQDRLGQYTPLRLPSGSSCTIKILFSRIGTNMK